MTLKQSRLSGEPRIELIGAPYGETRSRGLLEQMGFQSEIVAHTLRIFLPQGEAGNKALTRYMRGKDVVDVMSREGADVMGDIRFSLGIAAGRDLTEEQSADLTIERLVPAATDGAKKKCVNPETHIYLLTPARWWPWGSTMETFMFRLSPWKKRKSGHIRRQWP